MGKQWRRRIYGLEDEYGFAMRVPPGVNLSEDRAIAVFLEFLPYAISQQILKNLIQQERGSEQSVRGLGSDMLLNGARAYRDTANHTEYAIQECDNIFDVIAGKKAGERLLGNALQSLRNTFAQEYPTVAFRLYNNNRDRDLWAHYFSDDLNGMYTYGSHENYLFRDAAGVEQMLDVFFPPHLVALQIFVGGGCVDYHPPTQRFIFCRSARMPWITKASGSDTRGNRSFLIYRTGEELAGPPYRRFQVISNDANLFEPMILLKMYASSVMVAMIEDQYFRETVLKYHRDKFPWSFGDIKKIVRVANTAPLDASLPTPGFHWTLRSLAVFFAELRERYLEGMELPCDIQKGKKFEQELLEGIGHIPSGYDEDPTLFLTDCSDKALLFELVTHDMDRLGYTWTTYPKENLSFCRKQGKSQLVMTVGERLRYLEFAAKEIDPGMSIYDRRDAAGFIRHEVSEDRVKAMERGAPSTTRAHRRMLIFRELAPHDEIEFARWEVIRTKFANISFSMYDPLSPHLTLDDRAQLDELKARRR